MHSLDVALPPTNRPDPFTDDLALGDVTLADRAADDRAEPPRVIEIGEVTAGIAVPEGRGVRSRARSSARGGQAAEVRRRRA
jgi:hypothetical protein